MRILPAHKISTEIIDIVYEAKKRLVIVSPYVNLYNWERMASELRNALKRGVKIEFFVRSDADNNKSWDQVRALGINPILVPNLHAKFYFNEASGVISSMNLLSSSNSNSIEIACKLETEQELVDLNRFLSDFVASNSSSEIPSEDDIYLSKEKFVVVLENYLANMFECRTSVYFKNGAIQINTLSNRFEFLVDKVQNSIEIVAIVAEKEADKFDELKNSFFNSGFFAYNLHLGKQGYYSTVVASSVYKLSTSYLDSLMLNEKKMVIFEISNFLEKFDEFKVECSPYLKQQKINAL
jgi:hypothetical protein